VSVIAASIKPTAKPNAQQACDIDGAACLDALPGFFLFFSASPKMAHFRIGNRAALAKHPQGAQFRIDR
jgi:hypothetical protein